mmetsp:Transcript_18641/g.29708  ORF Transcript_18641/g.29708 Transcript_18641/m.29708 type:complete len:206 (+) Transcript_18641:759-1376(+)
MALCFSTVIYFFNTPCVFLASASRTFVRFSAAAARFCCAIAFESRDFVFDVSVRRALVASSSSSSSSTIFARSSSVSAVFARSSSIGTVSARRSSVSAGSAGGSLAGSGSVSGVLAGEGFDSDVSRMPTGLSRSASSTKPFLSSALNVTVGLIGTLGSPGGYSFTGGVGAGSHGECGSFSGREGAGLIGRGDLGVRSAEGDLGGD